MVRKKQPENFEVEHRGRGGRWKVESVAWTSVGRRLDKLGFFVSKQYGERQFISFRFGSA